MYNIKFIMDFLIFNFVMMMLIVILNNNIYFLNFLIGMEYLILMILFYMIMIDFNGWIYLIYLVYSVCEGVLGLSLLVSLNYDYGHQKISFLNLL
uniref:NADH dehydrogenase subunit 4L n=1 Tax=Bombus kashmirensis TaxID=395536 RepID=A0A482JJ38_9HYME|nr:NADH dehydrogenase subunit 4L [Bombus kashmirensis]